MRHFLHWQFVVAPVWLATLALTLQRFLLRFFSVRIMLRTLLTPWRKDTAAYLDRSLSGLFTTFLLNQISRFIGFILRSGVVLAWTAASLLLASTSLMLLFVFLTAPLWIVIGWVFGIQLVISSI